MEKIYISIIKYKFFFLSSLLIIMFIDKTNIEMTYKLDTVIIVVGNILIAVGVTNFLTQKNKKNEIGLDHCIKDISEILVLLKEIKIETSTLESVPPFETTKEILSKISILEQLILMLENHTSLVREDDLKKVIEIQMELESVFTEKKEIQNNWFDTVLKLQRHLLLMKSNIVKEYRS